MHSTVGAHTTLLLELISNAEAAINVKYDDISALHVASKSALTEALNLIDASTINQRILTVVDEAMTAAVAPGGLMDQCIHEEVTLAVITTVNKIVERKIHPRVQGTLNKIFMPYQDCIITERKETELELAASLLTHWTSAEMVFQDVINTTTSANIAKINDTLRSAKEEFEKKRASVVESIKRARRALDDPNPNPIPFTPPCTGLAAMAKDATPVCTTKVAWADAHAKRKTAQSVDVTTPTAPPTPQPP